MPIDHRFYLPKGALALKEVAELTSAELRGDGAGEITGIASASEARSGEVCFFQGAPKEISNISAEAAACFVTVDSADALPDGVAALVVELPRYALALLGDALFEGPSWQRGKEVSGTASVSKTAVIAPGVSIAPGAAIGDGTEIGPNSSIGPGVQIGKNCRIGANVSIQCALIGDHVKILSGARLGEAGFGVMAGPAGPMDAPHYGRVILQDHVTFGANSTIDRGVFGDTTIGEHTKIDNLCHIGHNVELGRGILMAAFGGISGSVVLEDGVMLGGRVGIADHVKVGKNAQLASSAGVFRDVPAGETWGGIPAKSFRQWMRETAWLQKQTKPKKKS